jgi:antibiotic biosynthesis monooxygenase (ABM) superfamily enzyme
MGLLVSFEDLLPHLESLSDAEAGEIVARAQRDSKYKTSLYGAFVVYVLAMLCCVLIAPAINHFLNPPKAAMAAVIPVVLLGMYFSTALFVRLGRSFYLSAVIRQVAIHRRTAA